MNNWKNCKNILIIRADNMGDLIMSSPAIRALKESFKCRITLLGSSAASFAAALIPEIDEFIIADLPWIKKEKITNPDKIISLSARLKNRRFDGCVIFTVYSQSALPAAMLAWMSDIPLRLAYCRENPYELLTHWVPDKEPYSWIRHQVNRDLGLVETIGAKAGEEMIMLSCKVEHYERVFRKLGFRGIGLTGPFILFHPGVSEPKRLFPEEMWISLVQEAWSEFKVPIYLTGSDQDVLLSERISKASGHKARSVAGLFNVPEFTAFISKASLMVSVNTGSVHLAAGVETPVVVLYARTNPQHTPWKIPHMVLEYSVPSEMQSRNEVIRYVNELVYDHHKDLPTVKEIIEAMKSVIRDVPVSEISVFNQPHQG